jgi:hypothetical protein
MVSFIDFYSLSPLFNAASIFVKKSYGAKIVMLNFKKREINLLLKTINSFL